MSDTFFAHPNAMVESESIGAGTRVWAFSHVMKGATIGSNCNIGEQCFIESHVLIGNDVVVKNGVAVWEGVTLEDRVFVGPNAVFTNDMFPRAKVFRPSVTTKVREGASIGANATIVCGITVGRYAMIGAGAVVTRDVADYALVIGSPARVHGYVCSCGQRLHFAGQHARCECGAEYKQDNGQVASVIGASR